MVVRDGQLAASAGPNRGGAAALTSAASTTNAIFTTLGLNTKTEMVVGADMLLALDAGAGWQHMFGGQVTTTNSFGAVAASPWPAAAPSPPTPWP